VEKLSKQGKVVRTEDEKWIFVRESVVVRANFACRIFLRNGMMLKMSHVVYSLEFTQLR